MVAEDLFRELVGLGKAIERTYGLSPELERLLKILRLQEFLKMGLSVRRALKAIGLGWKNYYKYAPIIYMDPGTTHITIQRVHQRLQHPRNRPRPAEVSAQRSS